MTFGVFGIVVPPELFDGYRPSALVAAACRSCGLPIVVRLRAIEGGLTSEAFHLWLSQLSQHGQSVVRDGVILTDKWPTLETTPIPEHLPASVERAYIQAEANFSAAGLEEPAAIMYRRALELALGAAFPDLTGSLASRIRHLVASHTLPPTIGEWLTQVRLIGNDGAHEADGVLRQDLEAARGFVDTALRYIFTLPAQVAARRKLAEGGG